MATYYVEVPIRGTWYCWVEANSKAEAMRKVNEMSQEVEGITYEIERVGKARRAIKESAQSAALGAKDS